MLEQLKENKGGTMRCCLSGFVQGYRRPSTKTRCSACKMYPRMNRQDNG